MTRHSFMQGALILFISGIFVKIVGFTFQILVIRLIGTEAVGLYNMVFPLYITVLVITTAGLPLAISKMVAQQVALNNYKAAIKIFKICLLLLVLLGFTFTVVLIIVSPFIIENLYDDPRVIWCFYTMLPGILIVSICSAFRGFFQGLQEMFAPAITQCVEQIVRVSLALILITKLQPYGIKMVAVGLSASMITGEIIGLILIYIFYLFKKNKLKKELGNFLGSLEVSIRKIILELFAFGFPTTLTRLTASLVLTFEASLIPLTLQKSGYNINQAASIYGQFSGVAITLLTIPTVLTFSLATSLVPSISEAEAQGKLSALQFRSTEALRLTYVFGLPVAIILFLKASNLSSLLFNLPDAGITLRYLACGAIFLYLAQTSNGILQGLGLVKNILFNTIVGAVIKILGIIYLVSIPQLNINGAAIAFVISYIVVCLLNLYIIYLNTGFNFTIFQIILPMIAAFFMGGLIFWETKILSSYLSQNLITIVSLSTGSFLYLFLVSIWKQINFKYIFKKKG